MKNLENLEILKIFYILLFYNIYKFIKETKIKLVNSLKLLFIFNIIVLLLTYSFLIQFLKVEIKLDNQLKYDAEDNIDFSEYSTTVKPIAIYKPYIASLNISNGKLNNYNQIIEQLKKNINLAKSHGIYGFAFYFSFFDKNISYNPLDIIIKNKNIKINFCLILKDQIKSDKIFFNLSNLFEYIKKYIEDERYIKFNNKYVIGTNALNFSKNMSFFLREKFRNNKLGDIFILSLTFNYTSKTNKEKIYDGFLYSPNYHSLNKIKFHYNGINYYFYTTLIYKNLFISSMKENNFFRMSVPMNECHIFINKTKSSIFSDYSPDKFFFLNKVIINWTKIKYDKENQYIFINDFNNLLKSPVFGYANINSFSKSLFGLPQILNNKKNFNIQKLERDVSVLMQTHVYYIELLQEIVNKTNNIPVPFDLFITTDNEEKKDFIEKYLQNQSKSNKFEILVTQNKGRDVIPCLIQLKDILLQYKYFCHIHTKKHGPNKKLGKYWQIYLYENLLGSKSIIKQILSDFENHSKLGIIFSEPIFFHLYSAYFHNHQNYYNMHKLFGILFPNKDIWPGNILSFPVGNMFWARTKAVYQIFSDKIIQLAPEESGELDNTIIHAIERIWLYLVKLNGFYYKTILYYI